MCAAKEVKQEDIIKETVEYVWKIPNHSEVVLNTDSLVTVKESFDFFTKTGVTYKWEVGYKATDDPQSFSPYLKLVSPVSKGDLTCVKTSLLYKHSGQGEWISYWTPESETPMEMSVHPELVISGYSWPIRQRFAVDSQQTMWWKVVVSLKVNNGPAQAEMRLKTVSLGNLQRNLTLLLDDSKSVDLKIICSDGVELFAHKTILYAQNPVFASMLTSDMKERNTGVITVDDISSSTMKLILHYLYTAELPEKWNDPDNIVEMTYASGKYQLTDFQVLLDNLLGKVNYGENNFKLLGLANKLSLKEAEARLLKRVKDLVIRATDADELYEVLQKF